MIKIWKYGTKKDEKMMIMARFNHLCCWRVVGLALLVLKGINNHIEGRCGLFNMSSGVGVGGGVVGGGCVVCDGVGVGRGNEREN